MKKQNVLHVLLLTIIILLLPLIGKQFSTEVAWTFFDFVAMGALIFGSGLVFEFLRSRGGSLAYTAGAAIAVATLLTLIWVNLAVGIIGSEDNPANAFYLAVPLIGIVGATLAKLKPRGMARTLITMAAAQLLVPIVAFIVWRPDFDPGVIAVFGLNAVFAVLFVVAGVLFQQAYAAR